MASGKQYREEFNLQIKYREEIAEHLQPEAGLATPVLGPQDIHAMEKWKIKRVFLYLSLTSALCMGALIVSPKHIVQVGVLCIWSSATALSLRLLKRSYHSTESDTPPT